MARVCVLGQSHPTLKKLMIRGTFTQRKKLWAAMESLATGKIAEMNIHDDMANTDVAASYEALCRKLSKAGRVTLMDTSGTRVFLVCETVMNEVRDWDATDTGELKLNPAARGADEGE